jgi:hypothetical protein
VYAFEPEGSKTLNTRTDTMTEDKDKNVIGGEVEAKAETAGGTTDKPKPGALVEDSTLGGLQTGGVAPKDPSGTVTEGGATDERENPSSEG